MLIIILIVLGIIVEIINANAWFIIPNFVSWVFFGLAGILFVVNIITSIIAKHKMKQMKNEFDKHFSGFGR